MKKKITMTTDNNSSNNIKPRTNLTTYVYQVYLLSFAQIDLHSEERKTLQLTDNESYTRLTKKLQIINLN